MTIDTKVPESTDDMAEIDQKIRATLDEQDVQDQVVDQFILNQE